MKKYIIQDMLGILQYVPYGIVIGMVCYMLMYMLRKKHNEEKFYVGEMLLFVYTALIIMITFLSRDAKTDIRVEWKLGAGMGINVRNNAYIVENILLFIPYGFLLGIAWKKGWVFREHVSAVFLTSLSIECMQLVSGRGVFQTDDIVTNTLGGIIGYILCCPVFLYRRKKKNQADR